MSDNPYQSPEKADEPPERMSGWRGPRLIEVLIVVFIIGLLTALLIPARRGAGEAARSTQCRNNLKQIGLAMHNYGDINGTFPPAYVADADGKPMHSWRVLILPHAVLDPLYRRYDQSQPWDSEANRQLLSQMPFMFRCPSSGDDGQNTSFVVVRGKETIFDADRPCNPLSIADGMSNTILVVEAPHANIPWTEPRDLDFTELSMLINDGANSPHSDHPDGVNVLFADGSVRFIGSTISPRDLRALLTKDAGDTVSGEF
jgi:prepilin-type processing-associated H-X9-DG protein